MIEFRNVTKLHRGVPAVDDVSFAVGAGAVTGFLGPNGAGKSTTIRMALGLERPTSGTVTVDGEPYRNLREPLRRVGALLNASWTHRSHTGRAHLRWLAASQGIPDTRVDEVLELVGLGPAAGKRTGAYSLGMLQRLGMAGALLGDPRYLLLDEPGNGLDPEGIVWLRDLVRQLAREGRGVLISSHLLAEIALVADDLVVIAQGAIMARTTVAAFVDAHSAPPDGVLVRVADGDATALVRVLDDAGLREVARQEGPGAAFLVRGTTPQELTRLVVRHGIALHGVSEPACTLEEAFMAAVAGQSEHRARRLPAGARAR